MPDSVLADRWLEIRKGRPKKRVGMETHLNSKARLDSPKQHLLLYKTASNQSASLQEMDHQKTVRRRFQRELSFDSYEDRPHRTALLRTPTAGQGMGTDALGRQYKIMRKRNTMEVI